MTETEFNLRVFFAIDLPEAVKSAVSEIIPSLKISLPKKSARWVTPEKYHVTLQFLRSVDPLDITRLINKTRAMIAGFTSFTLRFDSLGIFSAGKQSRILVLNLVESAELSELAAKIADGASDAGYPPEDRPFRGHLTLCRFQSPKKEWGQPDMQLDFPEFEVRQIELLRSERTDEGYEYSMLDRFYSSNG
jgi:RNA 2',3'-cyclic 3'-phosphodiesterase